jgi:hypothetical protein
MEGVSTKISGDPWEQARANIRHGRSNGTLALATKAITIRLMNVYQSTPSPA